MFTLEFFNRTTIGLKDWLYDFAKKHKVDLESDCHRIERANTGMLLLTKIPFESYYYRIERSSDCNRLSCWAQCLNRIMMEVKEYDGLRGVHFDTGLEPRVRIMTIL
jgi:hypothetical protein